ncbi:non-ribosomal peptide synthetase [Microcoleus sp. FACHB-672]|uniref:non-ribosomal peptide synthetase n=1 Tax=Microcoleus sp. FACHB-672 TaxID=2692825 RepID=UPI001682EAE8|nr:non-ribosomal peptide synthetase [Microcoleus sp. FACHB-672]MBD2040609.1 amino acid adenylation domain-containing protein [Microcoleus sp. FACHB-672]
MTLPLFNSSSEMPATSTCSEEVFVLPTSFAQQRLWFLDQFESGNSFYNLPAAVQLKGRVNIPVLEESFQEIVRRHEALRTGFTLEDGQPVQVIYPNVDLKLQIVDFTQIQNPHPQIQTAILEEAQTTFNLAEPPLLRITLIKLDEQEFILLVNIHHIVSDGWSLGVLIKELAALYEAFLLGKSSPLPELPIQYADFAIWQQENLQGEKLETQLNYWKQQLKDAPLLLELPADKPRSAVQTFRGARQSFVLSKVVSDNLKKFSNRENATLFMTLLAAFNALLYRYTERTDIIVGSPIANRNKAEIEGLIGFFVNTLILRTQLSENTSFCELLAQVREVTLGAYDHQDLPFEKLVEELKPERSLSHNPLFQVMFLLQNAPMPPLELPGVTLSVLDIDSGTSKFDLTLEMEEKPDGLYGCFEYNIDLFESGTISRTIGHFKTLLEGIVKHPEQRISQLPLLTEAEQHQLLIEWVKESQETSKLEQNLCIHQLFEAQVERTPDAIAAVFENQNLTYRELNKKANFLANHLQTLGVQPEVLVGICVERSLEMLVALLGILKAGGAYVPLDPTYPSERLAFMLQDAQVPVLLTQTRLLENLPKYSAQIVCLDQWNDGDIPSQNSIQSKATDYFKNPQLTQPCSSSNLAYVIYTSGSTGTPKGVMISHSNLINAYTAWKNNYSLDSTATCHLQMANFSFDVFSGDLIRALCFGGKLVLCPRDFLLEPEKLYSLMVQEKIDCAEFVPAVLRGLIQYLEKTNQSLKFMRLLIAGSDSWYGKEYQEVKRFCGAETRVINSYGLTEATIDSTYFESNVTELQSEGLIPIGRPFAGTQTYILDSHLQPVPVGVSGELYIGGNSLARGYLNRPDLTAEKFIPNPFFKEREGEGDLIRASNRLYKTGDLARYLPDGTIELLGRIDFQEKIRGFRIEISEIEAIINQHPIVHQSVIIARKDVPGEKRLVAYLVPSSLIPDPSFLIKDLREFIKEKLPDYMVPASFVILEALPLTPNGKVDRKALPAPHTTRPELEEIFTAPRTSVEETLAQIWSQVLGLKQVSVDDNFFELGGDSILSIQVIAKAHQAGLKLKPKQLFQYQTIAQLAAVAGTTTALESQQELITGKFSLTPIQHWFFEQNLSDSHHWNQSILLKTKQPLNLKRVEEVVRQLLRHHDALRLRFLHEETGWQQENAEPDEAVPFSEIDLSSLPAQEQEPAMQKAVDNLQASLNLSQGPLMRVALFDFGDQKPNYLLFVIHHLAVDGVSWRILIEDFQTAYEQLSRNEALTLPAKTTSFKQWSERLNLYAQSGELKQELNHWLSHSGKKVSPLPVDHVNGTNTVATANTVSVTLSVEETRSLLQEVSAAYHTQINDVLLTALLQAFEEWTGKQTLLVDLEGHGREDIFENVNLSHTVGWFTSLFPVWLYLEATHPGEALKAVKEQLRGIPNHGIGYGILRYLTGEIADTLLYLPQAEVSFNYLGQFDQVLPASSLFALSSTSPGLTCSPRGNRSYLLEINGFVVSEKLQIDWTYSQEIHQQSTIENLAQGFMAKLQTLIAHCQSPDAGGYTPSDFAEFQWSQWSQEDLDKINAVLGEV